jgi:very-short-patch-repair endonuclease
MGHQTTQGSRSGVWTLVKHQHGIVTRGQLLELGLTPEGIKHRITSGRLRPLWRGVYAVGRPEVSRYGRWMAAILSCGSRATLSHLSAAALWEIGTEMRGYVEISVPAPADPRRGGILVHRRSMFGEEQVTRLHGIPVTTPILTLIDLATRLDPHGLEAAVNEADKLDLARTDDVRCALDVAGKRPGVGVLRALLDRRTFTLTDSELERRFLRLVRRAGLPLPLTQQWVNGFKVDFYWPALGLVVETDGLRYHRTPAQQARDRARDQAHTAAGLTALRFTHAQVASEPERVEQTLRAVAARLLMAHAG